MLPEIEAAVKFLTRLVAKDTGGSKTKSSSNSNNNNNHLHQQHNNNDTVNGHSNGVALTEEKIQEFSRRLTSALQSRFRNHWYPERPSRGQAYRCIRINENCSIDVSIAKACQDCGISYESLRLPVELTLWIDPNEVTCRFGEHKGSYCIVAKLSDGRQENYVNSINIEELEQQSLEHSKQSLDVIHARKKRQQTILHQRNKNSPLSLFNTTNAGSTTYHQHHPTMNGSLANGGSPSAHLVGSSHSPHVPVTSAAQAMNGYVDAYGPNGLLPTTSAGVSMPYHSHFSQPHFYPQASFQQHHVGQHSTHFGSPTSHLFTKYNLGLQQQSQQGPSQSLAGSRALNAASLATSGTFRSSLASNSNAGSGGSKQVSSFQSPANARHNTGSPVLVSLGSAAAAAAVSHHGNTTKSTGNSSSSINNAASSNANASSFARGLQTAFNLAAAPFTPSSVVGGVSTNGPSSTSVVVAASAGAANYQSVAMDKDRRHMNAAAASATAIVTNRF